MSSASRWISTKFSLDLLSDPLTRDVTDVKHVIGAVASRSVAKAGQFVNDVWKEAGVTTGKEAVKLYGSYDEIYASKVSSPRAERVVPPAGASACGGASLTETNSQDVDVLYIGTPHSNHYQNCVAALTAGKSVLCEKSLVVNGEQAAALVDLARSKVIQTSGRWLRES